uniref:Poor homologous synapsis 1 PH domain-containing protein n=1 Tax=Nelumbo nucifera TaxID=4432 RepID=A0A822XD86_NELNU|nr:TPA_asm: hypothetical protein HUJ06_019305 [Nelumbo nucifera]
MSLTLKPLRKTKRSCCKGTWISSSLTVALHLLTYHPNPKVIVVVTLRGKIHVSQEETKMPEMVPNGGNGFNRLTSAVSMSGLVVLLVSELPLHLLCLRRGWRNRGSEEKRVEGGG